MSLFTIAGNDTEHAQWCTDHRPAAHALAARPIREMTLDCRTLWSVRFCAAKGHFCSLLLSNILVTSAFCRLTISPTFFIPHSRFSLLLSLCAGCSYRLELLESINRLAVSSEFSGNRYLLITLNNLTSLRSIQKKRWKEIFLLERCFPFVTIYYHEVFAFSTRNIV